MSKHEEANLILKLYELRREETMRKARDWYVRDFHPDSSADIDKVMFSEQGAYMGMVVSYWDMAAALVNHGAIDLNLFVETNGEHMVVFCKFEPFLAESRAKYSPQFLVNLEKLIDSTPNGRERVAGIRERMKMIRAHLESQKASAAQG